MDIWHKLCRIFRISNLGTCIFFVLNILLILVFFCPNGITIDSAAPLLLAYLTTVLISISPAGEWMLAFMAGAHEIKRKYVMIKMIPLLEEVLNRAKNLTPDMVKYVHLKIIHDPVPNAFAIGSHTICITDGLLDLSDNAILGILAHEVGHLAYKHTTIQLLIGGGNVFIAGCLVLIKIAFWIVTGIFEFFLLASRHYWIGVMVAVFGVISSGMIWLWTKFCMLFLMWSMRQNEFIADEYAYKLGFGAELARVLDSNLCSHPSNGLINALYSTHPNNYDRVSHLQDVGTRYSRYF